jgi:DNA-binding winged helix-turn-helix (wHTH) protein
MDELRFVFGPFVVIPAQRLLQEDGRQVRLGSRALDFLIVLLARARGGLEKRTYVYRLAERPSRRG